MWVPLRRRPPHGIPMICGWDQDFRTSFLLWLTCTSYIKQRETCKTMQMRIKSLQKLLHHLKRNKQRTVQPRWKTISTSFFSHHVILKNWFNMPTPLRPGPRGHLPTPAPVRPLPGAQAPGPTCTATDATADTASDSPGPEPDVPLLPWPPASQPPRGLGWTQSTCRRNSPVLSVASRRRPSSWSPPLCASSEGTGPLLNSSAERGSSSSSSRVFCSITPPRGTLAPVPPCCAASMSSTPGAGKPLLPRPTKRRAQDLPPRRPPQPNKLTAAAAALALKFTQAISRGRAARSPVQRSPPARRLPWLPSPTLQIAL